MFYELIQLSFYAGVFVLFAAYLRSAARIEPLLRAMVAAASLVAVLGIAGYMSGVASAPHIYLGRGSNEGSLFVLLSGVIPAMTLFITTRHPGYLALSLLMAGAQMLATSRANLALSLLAIGIAGFFLVRSRSLRALVLVATAAALVSAAPFLHGFYERLLNYSVLERIALYEAGWAFWLERPWTGWGWGATSELAPQNTFTDQSYPHFHSTYIQFLVELGVLGWLAIVAWVTGSLWLILSASWSRGNLAAAYYVAVMSMALLGAGFTQALLFGADRAIQVMLALALIGALRRRARLLSSERRIREFDSAPVSATL
jgi:O-antigen ligase